MTDQSFVFGRDIFDNISKIVDEVFNSYIRREGAVEPLFAQYCDGVRVQCEGLSQWGSQELAEDGLTPIEILRYYYGDDIEIVRNVPVQGLTDSLPPVTLRLGSISENVRRVQIRLNRISQNYPNIPKIYPTDGIFDANTEKAVIAFQETFNLTPDGIVGEATWYAIQRIYAAVKKLSELNSEGLSFNEVSQQFVETLQIGSTGVGVSILQYYLSYIALFVGTVGNVAIDGSFGPSTEEAVKDFQRTYGLPVNGVVDEVTWDKIYNVYLGAVESVPVAYREGVTIPFPGRVLRLGSEGEDVRTLQEYLNYIGTTYPEIPHINVDGIYGAETVAAVEAFQKLFSLPGYSGQVTAYTWNAISNVYNDIYGGNRASAGQYPGYDIS